MAWFIEHCEESLRWFRKTYVLLYGPPGTCKTLLAKAIASHIGGPLLSIDHNLKKTSEFLSCLGEYDGIVFITGRQHLQPTAGGGDPERSEDKFRSQALVRVWESSGTV